MDEVKTEKKKIKLSSIVFFVAGTVLLLFGIGLFAIHYIFWIEGIFFIMAAIITIHSAASNMGKEAKISMSGIKKFLMVIILVELGLLMLIPPPCTFLTSP